jgi:dipeptidyl aminopeptidase/acylaminoacyl peptidase
MTVDDLLALEGLGEVAPSPDGRVVAVVVQRARTQPGAPIGNLLGNDDRGDVWLVSPDGLTRRNLTGGARDGSSHWQPVWSPNGRWLAMLSTRGGGNVRMYVWDSATGRMRRLADFGVEVNATVKVGDGVPRPFAWVTDSTLLAVLLPKGQAPAEFDIGVRTTQVAASAWRQAERAREATVSIIDGGAAPADSAAGPEASPGRLTLLHALGGTARVIAPVPTFGQALQIAVSPGGGWAALVATTAFTYSLPTPLARASWGGAQQVGIVALHEDTPVRWLANLDPMFSFMDRYNPARGFGYGFAVGWSPDDRSLAVLGTAVGESSQAPSLFLIPATAGAAAPPQRAVPIDWGVSAASWTGSASLLVRATTPDQPRSVWWRLDVASRPCPCTTAAVPGGTPQDLLYLPGEQTAYGITDGELWGLDTRGGAARRLTDMRAGRVQGIAWPWPGSAATTTLVLRVEQDGRPGLRLFDLRRSMLDSAALTLSRSGAELVAYLPERDLALFRSGRAADGPFLWAGSTTRNSLTALLALNPHLAEVESAPRRLIEYRGADGGILKGLLLLPVGYREGTRYPLVVWVYAGSMVRDSLHGAAAMTNEPSPYNAQLLAARGYAVLFPSMPIGPDGVAGDPYIDLPKGVTPAIDKVIDLGIADPDRVGLLGLSYGGYSTYALVTYTKRFAAAIGFAGMADLVSLYGTFDPRKRYDPGPYANLGAAVLAEGGQIRMGGPPWEDLWRYIRNSPIHYVDRVQTPLMLVHGDMDYIPIQQAEEFFSALHRRGQRVRMVRYWGEGHAITAAPNIRDMWGRIFGWFGEYLGVPEPGSSGSGS